MPNPKNILCAFADNASLMDAVKAVLLRQLESPMELTADTSDIVLGQHLRANIAGKKAVEDAWKEISRYKSIADKPVKENPAR